MTSQKLSELTCIIFAGGRSSRMGEDKALLSFGGYNSLAEYQYHRLSKIFSKVYISAKSDKFDFEVTVIKDSSEKNLFAPTAGFEAVFKTLPDERVFVLSVDAPFVTEKELKTLLEKDTSTLDAVIAKTVAGSHPMCGIYHRSLLPKFTQMIQEDNHRLGQLLKSSHTEFVHFEDEAAFANLNNPEEFKEALTKLSD